MFNQYKFDGMPKYNNFRYWFIRKSSHIWEVYNRESTMVVTQLDENCEGVDMLLSSELLTEEEGTAILAEFSSFKTRPEYFVGMKINVSEISAETAVELYETMLVGIMFIRAHRGGVDPDTSYNRFKTCLDWLRTTDMYTAPASTQYHESFPSGLLFHTLKVYSRIIELMELSAFKSVSYDSATLVALVHDWCKIGLYEQYMRNAKNDETGKWDRVPSYRHKQTGIPLGHGASSMYIASKFFRLSQEEAVAIRWHMGAWRVVSSEMDELQLANENYPLVHLLQFADQLSIVNYVSVA